MTISPSNTEYNLRKRELYCKKCQTIVVHDRPDARCGECNSKLITVIFKDELVTSANSTT